MMKTYKEWFAQYMEEFRRDHPDSEAPSNSMLSDFYDKYVREFKAAEKARIKLEFVNTDEFTQIDWDTEIADEVPVQNRHAVRAQKPMRGNRFIGGLDAAMVAYVIVMAILSLLTLII